MDGTAGYDEVMRQSRAHDGANEPAKLFRATCDLLRRGDPRANELLQRLQQYPEYAVGWLALARTLKTLDQPAAASTAFDQALVPTTAPVEAALEKADLMMASTAAGTTASWLAGVRHRWPNDARLVHKLGRARYQAGELEAADGCLREAVEQAPDFAAAWFHLGLVVQDLGRPDEAAKAYRAALAARPDMFEAALNLGISLQDSGAIEPAMDAYARAVRLRPACFNRVAQALTSASTGCLWLEPTALRRVLARRA